jgi:hypothetical protein
VQELNGLLREDQIPAGLVENMFLCKLCKAFCGIKLKAPQQPDYLKTQSRSFYWEHKNRFEIRTSGSDEQHDLRAFLKSGYALVRAYKARRCQLSCSPLLAGRQLCTFKKLPSVSAEIFPYGSLSNLAR